MTLPGNSLIRWSPAEEAANAELRLDREQLHKRYGNALKLVNAQISKAPTTKKHYETRLKLLEKLGWTEWQKHQKQDLQSDFQPNIRRSRPASGLFWFDFLS